MANLLGLLSAKVVLHVRSFTISFKFSILSPYSVFSSVNSIMDSGDDSCTLGAADGGCGYCCHIVYL